MFTPADRRQIAARGISVPEAQRHLRLLQQPPVWVTLDRPARAGDGIRRVEETEAAGYAARHAAAALDGKILHFIPASGAASRMFKDLLAVRGRTDGVPLERLRAEAQSGSAEAGAALELLDRLGEFAFAEAMQAREAAAAAEAEEPAGDDVRLRLAHLLEEPGLGYARLPKGLIPFHRAGARGRTPFEEHLREAAQLARAGDGAVRLHFTVPAEHRGRFEELLAALRKEIESECSCRLDVTFSVQKSTTDTLAADDAGAPFRDDSGSLVFRPAGHGALLANLQDAARAGADIVFVKNIDNVAAAGRSGATHEWVPRLTGLLLEARERAHDAIHALERGGAAARDEAVAVLAALGLAAPAGADAQTLRALLDRPIRVCGMVPNTGEPGGGPFWVKSTDGATSLQIVETAQVNPADSAAVAVLRAATHFNPVFMVLSLRDAAGHPFELDRFADPEAIIVTRKSAQGRELVALERPGLWNGGMGRWITLFVEIPGAVFTPVKTVNDLLRPEHQPPKGAGA